MSIVHVERAFEALRRDLITDEGPRISTLRNYPFAILVYSPQDEFEMRQQLGKLTAELKQNGWFLHTVNIKALVMKRLREAFTPDEFEQLVAMEERLTSYDKDPAAGFGYVRDMVSRVLEGDDGLAGLVRAEIDQLAARSDRADRTVVFVGHLGAMYPFLRLSPLLRHLDGKTHGIPVVMLYPGKHSGQGLSFLEEADADSDYRPRIYTHESIVV